MLQGGRGGGGREGGGREEGEGGREGDGGGGRILMLQVTYVCQEK